MRRVLSAAVLLAILVGTIFWLPWWATAALAGVAAALAGHELAKLGSHQGVHVPAMFAASLAAAVAVALALQPIADPGWRVELLTSVLFGGLVAGCALTLASGATSPATFTAAAVLSMAPVYVGLPLGALAWVQATSGPWTLSWLIVVIAASDSAQYYTGRMFGRRKLAPTISPGKTVEGAIGGLVVASVAGGALGALWLPEEMTAVCVVLALVLALAGMAGDLFESLLKRSAGVKDSSSLIPGHGGVLDRVDSYLLAAPVYYLYLINRG